MARQSHFEAIIVGGGPAGSAAAVTLASHGVTTCVLDRASFPREKLCGGLLTLRSKKIFERVFETQWDQIIDAEFNGISVFYNGATLAQVRDYSALFATQRYRFDNFLLRLAESKGAVLQTGLSAKRIDGRANSVTLSDGSAITFDYLIGADGANSLVARCLFGKSFDPSKIGFGLELIVSREDLPSFPAVPEVHLGAARWGYGWVFPKGDHAVLGVGGLHKSNPGLTQRFNEFLSGRCGCIPKGRIKGQFLPYGDFRPIPGNSNIMLVGDAAGLVDSMSGEGIAFAMQSGNAAALSIIGSNCGSLDAFDLYRARYEDIIRIIKLSNRYRPLVFLPVLERLFARTLMGADTIQRSYLDIFADELAYDRMPALIMGQLCSGVLKSLKLQP